MVGVIIIVGVMVWVGVICADQSGSPGAAVSGGVGLAEGWIVLVAVGASAAVVSVAVIGTVAVTTSPNSAEPVAIKPGVELPGWLC